MLNNIKDFFSFGKLILGKANNWKWMENGLEQGQMKNENVEN